DIAYALWLLVLLKAVTPPIWSSPTSVFSWMTRDNAVPVATVPLPRPPMESADVPKPVRDSLPFVVAEHEVAPVDTQLVASDTATQNDRIAMPTIIEPERSRESRFQTPSIVGSVWLLGAVLFAGYQLINSIRFCRSIRSSSCPADGNLMNRV